MLVEILDDTKKKFENTINHLRGELNLIRSSQTSPSLVEDIQVQVYDGRYPIKELAAISVPEPTVILIQPWDQTVIPAIETALLDSDLGVKPVTDGLNLRLNIPSLSEERRRELVKKVGIKTEEAKIAIRNIRQEKIKSLDNLCDDSKISEDEHKSARKEVQDLVDEHNKKVEEMKKNKVEALEEI